MANNPYKVSHNGAQEIKGNGTKTSGKGGKVKTGNDLRTGK